MLVQPNYCPKLVTVSKRLLVELCNDDWPDELTTNRLNTLFIVVNCGQRLVATDWRDRRRSKDYRPTQKSIEFPLRTKKAAAWCGCTPKALYKRLSLFKPTKQQPKLPVGFLKIEVEPEYKEPVITLAKLPPPILNFTRFKNSAGRELVTVSLDMAWVHVPPLFVRVPMPLPVGNKSRVIRHLERALRDAPV